MGVSLSQITDSVAGQLPSVPPDSPALAFDDQPALSWAQLRETELRYARALQRAGVGRGDRVGILLQNSCDYVALYLAIARVGAISVRINWRLTAPEIAFILDDAGPEVLIFDAALGERVAGIRDAGPVTRYVVRPDGRSAPDWATPLHRFAPEPAEDGGYPSLGMDDPATIMYTSGTTGRPKGAVLTHGNALWMGAIQSMKWKIDPATVALNCAPLFHAGGFEVLLLPTLVSHGTSVTFASGGFSLERLLDVGRRHGATSMLVYSFMLYELARMPDLEERVPSSLARIVTGGDTVMPWIYDAFAERIPQVQITQSYSLTEGGVVAVCLDPELARGHESSVGRPQPMTEVKVVGETGEPVAPGEVGEIHLRSPGVSPGYWRLPEASAETFVDGWCRTGDLGRIDEEGFLTLAGRAKDMYRSGGENVYPAEIEKVLTSHPDVGDAAVIGVPDGTYVEVGAAVVVAGDGRTVDPDDVRGFLAARLATYKVPRYVHVVDELPRTVSGKVRKTVLRERYGVRTPIPPEPRARDPRASR